MAWSAKQIDAAAAAAAEMANGGKFGDPLFYKPEHQAFWRTVVSAALEAAAPETKQAIAPVTNDDVERFSAHCRYIYSIAAAGLRVWKDSNEQERKSMEAAAPQFFANFGQVFGDFLVLAACRITDAARDARNNESFTLELFLNHFVENSETRKALDPLYRRIMEFRKKLLPARHKLVAHVDRDIVTKGAVLPAGTWAEWEAFWSDLRAFVHILNQATTGKVVDVTATTAGDDASALIRRMQ